MSSSFLLAGLLAIAPGLLAQVPATPASPPTAPPPAVARSVDTLRLAELHAEAERADPRAAQLEWLASQSRLRLENLRAERMPSIGLLGLAQYLSDVPSIGGGLPGGPPLPPHDNYDAHVAVRQRLFDPSSAPRRAVERAQLAESEARVRTALYAQRVAVNEAFFSALLLDAQRSAIAASITELTGHREAAARRVTEGAALPSETARLDAELLRLQQAHGTLGADRDAAREVLGALIGRAVGADAELVLPVSDPAVLAETVALPAVSGRPERAQFARSRDLLAERRAVVNSADQPRVSAFARAGHGRPGLNPLARDFDSYWLAGVQVDWSPFDWGNARREQQVLALQSEVVASEEAAFDQTISRTAVRVAAAVRQLARTLETDERIVTLHRGVLDETRLRYGEGVITSAELIDRQGDLLTAELAQATHRVQLAEAKARLLTTLGREIR